MFSWLFLNMEGRIKEEHLRLRISQLLVPRTLTNYSSWHWPLFSAKGSFSDEAEGHANLLGGSIWEAVWQHFHLQNNASRFTSSFDLPSYGPLAMSTIMSNKFPLGCKILMQSENRIFTPSYLCYYSKYFFLGSDCYRIQDPNVWKARGDFSPMQQLPVPWCLPAENLPVQLQHCRRWWCS